jgi:hypothetical protein
MKRTCLYSSSSSSLLHVPQFRQMYIGAEVLANLSPVQAPTRPNSPHLAGETQGVWLSGLRAGLTPMLSHESRPQSLSHHPARHHEAIRICCGESSYFIIVRSRWSRMFLISLPVAPESFASSDFSNEAVSVHCISFRKEWRGSCPDDSCHARPVEALTLAYPSPVIVHRLKLDFHSS